MIEHYSTSGETTEVEIFHGAKDEAEVLAAITEWWKEAEPQYFQANVDAILFEWDDEEEGCGAEVHWHWITEEVSRALMEEYHKPLKLTVDIDQISLN